MSEELGNSTIIQASDHQLLDATDRIALLGLLSITRKFAKLLHLALMSCVLILKSLVFLTTIIDTLMMLLNAQWVKIIMNFKMRGWDHVNWPLFEATRGLPLLIRHAPPENILLFETSPTAAHAITFLLHSVVLEGSWIQITRVSTTNKNTIWIAVVR